MSADDPLYAGGRQIINIASVAAFQPIPYIDVYGASKAFVLSFSRALNRELRGRGIRVMALCPFWTGRPSLPVPPSTAVNSVVKKYVAMYEPEQMVQRAWRDAKRGEGCEPVRLCGPVPDGADEAPAPQSGDGCMDASAEVEVRQRG